MFKRSAEMKDSGGVFHGIGGLLDTLDSLMFTPVVFYILMKFIP
jgi:phosphatidate cytidylyltransferase